MGESTGTMYEPEQHNPFENHINSEAFDVSKLDHAIPRSEMDREMERFFNELPLPLNHELWDTELDDRQKIICAHLATELIDRVLRVHHEDIVEDLSDDQLISLLTVPITLALIAEQRLHSPRSSTPKSQILFPPPLEQEEQSPASPARPDLKLRIRSHLIRARDFIMRLFQRS